MVKKSVLICLLLSSLGVMSVQSQVRLPERPNRPSYVDHSELDNGFWCAVEATGGSSIMYNHTNAQRAGITVTGGYMVNEYLKLGIGFGANSYVNHNEPMRRTDNTWTLPLYADVRGNLISQESRNFVPYWSMDVGGAIGDGFFFSPTIGMRFGEKRDSWLLGVSYGLYSIRESAGFPQYVSFASLKIGYEF